MSGDFSYDVGTPAGQVRLLATDTSANNPIFGDREINAFLGLEGDNIKRAAALALETIAASEVLTLKVIKLLELQTDGAKTTEALLKRAGLLRAQASTEDAADDGGFDVAGMVVDPFTARERWWQTR